MSYWFCRGKNVSRSNSLTWTSRSRYPFSHDLGEDLQGNLLPTGYDLVKYICEKGLRANKIYIHTDNPVGRENMYQTLHGAKRRGFIDSDIEIYHYSITENKYTEWSNTQIVL